MTERQKVMVSTPSLRRQSLAVGIVAAFALSLGAGSTAAMASSGGNPMAMSAILSTEQAPQDLLPLEGGKPFADGLGLVGSTSRSLGSTETTKYWLVLDADANVCVVSQFTSDGSSTIACTPADDFQKSGILSVQLSGADYAEAYLVPDGLQPSEVPAGLEQLESGLIAGDSRTTEGALTFTGGDAARGAIVQQVQMRLLHPEDGL